MDGENLELVAENSIRSEVVLSSPRALWPPSSPCQQALQMDTKSSSTPSIPWILWLQRLVWQLIHNQTALLITLHT